MSNDDIANSLPDRILDKIKKCLALSKSSNANEANIALRQARKLMDQYKFDSADAAAFDASEYRLVMGKRPPNWSMKLGGVCAEAFSCAVVVCKSHTYSGLHYSGVRTELSFIGVGSYPEMASYAYDVLSRQLSGARQEYVSSLSSRCKLSTKRRRGEIFADAWINSVYQLIAEFSGCDDESITAINAYKKVNFPELKPLELKHKKVYAKDQSAKESGRQEGRKASLYKPVNNERRERVGAHTELAQLTLL